MFTDTPPKGETVEYFVRAIGPDSKTDYVSCGTVTIPDDPTPPATCSVSVAGGVVEAVYPGETKSSRTVCEIGS